MATFLLVISLIITVYLGAYALVFIFLSADIWFVKNKKTENAIKSYGEVSVLIPAYNESEGIIDSIATVLKQNYPNKIKIYVLANNEKDNIVLPLQKTYKYKNSDSTNKIIKLSTSEKREVFLIFTGLVHKKDKINFWTPNITSEYIGLLDADHRAENNWISSSLSKMEEEKTNVVQSRRQPLAISTLFQIWDSAQNHIGNELVNTVLNQTSHSIFFTGTTCIFKSEIFKKYKFAENLTEDTYLSYDLICDGEKISYNNNSSSYEEVAYNAKSYIFRRRRWSAGHTKTFFDHLKKIITSPLKFFEKIKLLIHGQFFLIPIAVCLLLNIYGIYFFFQFTRNIELTTLLISTTLSLAISAYFSKKGNNFIVDGLVSFFWIFPQISILAIWFYYVLGSEIYYYIISFPLTRILSPFQITLLFIPLLMLVSGTIFFKQFKPKNLLLLPTYPIFMFLDIYACLLGFADFVLGKYNWVEIGRQNFISEETVPQSMRSSMSTGKTIKTGYKKLIWVVSGIIVILLANDLLAFDNCGKTKAFLWQPIFIHPSSPVIINSDIEKQIVGTSTLEILIKNRFTSTSSINIENYLDGKLISNKIVIGNGEDTETVSFPLGWDSHKINVVIKSPTISCARTEYFSTTFKEIKNDSLFVNGEKFLIKGIIPSFSNSLTNMPMNAGLAAIKNAGANTVRFYHYTDQNIKNIAAEYNLMLIDQPDASTWNEVNPNNSFDEKSYLYRYNKMVKDNEGYPFLLLNGLGNEWELGGNNPTLAIPKIKNLIINAIASSTSSELSTYSTYLTFVNYPVDVLGINMLDTGKTYWTKAISVLKSLNKPFYASEFGGFVAFWETVPRDLRIERFTTYWNELLDAGGLGANFFESNDNWAQPVVNGYNDPFKPDQPDDTRGLWDEKNNPKLELKFLEEMFSDFQINIINKTIPAGTKEISVELTNKREYSLQDVILNYENTKISVGNFKPLESKIIKLPIDSSEFSNQNIQIVFNYTSHSGFKEISTNNVILPILGDEPVILNNDFVPESTSTDDIKGRLLLSNKIEAVIPDSWTTFEFNGTQMKNNGGMIELPIINPYHNVSDLQFSQDGINWQAFDSGKIAGGLYYIRFKLPKITNSEKYLILSGLGASSISIDYGDENSTTLNTFNYRENIIDLAPLGQSIFNNYITLTVNRQQTVYINNQDSPSGQEVLIDMEKPVVFSPADIEIKKIF